MKRRQFMNQTASVGIVAAAASLPASLTGKILPPPLTASAGRKLTPPVKGKIPVAFAISEGVTVIDFAGPWEVFQDVMIRERGKDMDEQMPFQLFTVSGIDLALRVVDRYFGREVAQATATYVEYQSKGWVV